MADTAARLALVARRYEVARFTIAVRGIDLSGVAMAMQVRLQRGTPGAPLIALGTVTTTAAEGLKLDSVTVVDGVPVSIIKGRINQSTMSDAAKVPYAGELGDDTTLAYAMQWTLGGDAQTRIEGDLIVRDSAFGSDNAPAGRPAGYGAQQVASGGSGALTFGDQVIAVSIDDMDLVAPYAQRAEIAADKAEAEINRLLGDTSPPYTNGRSTALPAITGALPGNVYLRDQPLDAAGIITSLYVDAAAAGTAYFKVYDRDGTRCTQAGPDTAVSIPAAGAQSIALPAPITVKAGQYTAIYAPGVVRFQGGAPAGLQHGFFQPNVAGNVGDFTASSNQAAFGNEIGFGVSVAPFTYQQGQALAVDAAQELAGLEAALAVPPMGTMGVATLPGVSGAQPDRLYVRMEPAPASGIIDTLSLGAAGAGKVKLKVFSFDGTTFKLMAQAAIQVAVAGAQALPVPTLLPIMAGQYVGIYGPGVVQYLGGSPGIQYGFLENAGGEADSFTPTGTDPAYGNSFAYGVRIRPATIGELQTALFAPDDAVAESQLQIGEVIDTAKVAVSGTSVAVTTQVRREGTALAAYTATLNETLAASSKVRYDIVALDMVAGTFAILKGTERTTDPTVYSPDASLALQQVAVAKLRVTDSSVTAIMVHDVTDGTLRALDDEMTHHRQRSHNRLRRTRAAISSGSKVAIIGLGDSITGIQYEPQGGPGDLSQAPNGVFRDRATTAPGYLTPSYGADYVASVPTYTAAQLGRADDGAGKVHTRIGWNWGLVSALEARGYTLGATVTYDNFGIAGAASSALYSGSSQPWLNSVIALIAAKIAAGFTPVVTFCIGMNELGNAGTAANASGVIKTLRAAGADVVVIGLPRPRDSFSSAANRQLTNRALARAAEYNRVAFVPIFDLAADDRLRAVGIFPADLAEANSQHHPGVTELAFDGRELVRHVVDGL